MFTRTMIPEGWREVKLTAWTDGRRFVVPEQGELGLPDEEVPDDPDGHSCDAMGCGAVGPHVIARFALPEGVAAEMPAAAARTGGES